jgi:hypothetical protein
MVQAFGTMHLHNIFQETIMHQFVQSALEAANQGDKNKAIDFIKQVLASNPNDVDAWLVLAAVLDDPERKRQCLKRVLTLDPTNQIAREEMLEMDRAAMGGTPAHMPDLAPVSPVLPPSTKPLSSNQILSETTMPVVSYAPGRPKPRDSAKPGTEKPLVFKYPLFWRILMYAFVAFFGCVGLLVASQNFVNSLPFLGLALIMGITAMAFSPQVEVSEKGIRASGTFSSAEIGWYEIVKIRSNTMKRRLELSSQNGEVVNVSNQVSGYPRIVEILRQRRPDLFGKSESAPAQGNFSSGDHHNAPTVAGNTNAAFTFTGTKIYRKSFMAQYGSYFLVVPFCLISAWTIYAEPQYKVGASLAVLFCLLMICLPFFQVSQLKVEPDKLTTETFFGEKAYSAQQIKNISMKTVRGRGGRASNYVHIEPSEGGAISLTGFSEGDEVLYGFLTNWWETYKHK